MNGKQELASNAGASVVEGSAGPSNGENLMQSTALGLLEKVAREAAARQHFPESTYRLQFNAKFTFRDARQLVPYLHELGITHCYASPYLKARPGSMHGYDIIDHRVLNPEIGTEDDYNAWVNALREHGLGQILDMVPNHMGITGNQNEWWNDVLENGPSSPYAGFFDIAWTASPRPELQDRVLLPVLGDPYGKVLESQQIQLRYEDGAFTIWYFDHRFPVAPGTYDQILSRRKEELEQALGADAPEYSEYVSIVTAIGHLPGRTETDPAKVAERQREKEVIKRRLTNLAAESAAVRAAIERIVADFNGTPGDPHSFDLLDRLLDSQPYRLAYWRVASDEINYRRFFDINELAALSMEKPEVFEATHELVFRYLREKKINGLRIDHPDGLYDPKQYFTRLQEHYLLALARGIFESDPEYRGQEWKDVEGPLLERVRTAAAGGRDNPLWRPLYVIAEKILGTAEPLPEDWQIHGTSGYGFVNVLNGLFVDAANADAFTRLYHDWTRMENSFPEIVYQKKFLILQVALSSELHMLAYQLDRLAQKNRDSRDFTLHSLRHALREIIACFPVYRSYISDEGVHETDQKYVHTAVNRGKFRNPELSTSLFRFVRDMLLLKYPETSDENDRAEQLRFAGKFQQVTAPVMAKGLEDTAFYVYNRLVSLNEVGGNPDRFGVAPSAVHRYNQARQASWPWAFSTTSTHDTKRSEDVRARINVLSEMPAEWEERLVHWSRLNAPFRVQVEDTSAPDPNEEYFLYQNLVGAWPLEPYGPEEYAAFVKRIQEYMLKATHEAKVHTSWINPDPDYDEAVQQFVGRILDDKANAPFVQDLRSFQKRISHYGLFNSLAQTLLKFTSPGVPDTYQGTELWDFSLVDPDNRRPVDYERRRKLLQELKDRVQRGGPKVRELAEELLAHKEDGRIKLYVTYLALHCRRDNPGLFATGDYLPLEPAGARAEHVFAFARRQGNRTALVVVPRLLSKLVPDDQAPVGKAVWEDTHIPLPEGESNRRWTNLFTGEVIETAEGSAPASLQVADVLAHFPVALLVSGDTPR